MASPKATPNLMKILKGLSSREPTTGMADSVNARITETGEPAALSHGEYVIDAQTVAMIGDGNSDAGAKVLDGLVGQVRKMKGVKDGKQPKELGGPTTPPMAMPKMKMGGLARYAEGGKVMTKKEQDAILYDVDDPDDIEQLIKRRDSVIESIDAYKANGDIYSDRIAKEKSGTLHMIQERINELKKKIPGYKPPPANNPRGYNKGGKVSPGMEGLLRTLGVLK